MKKVLYIIIGILIGAPLFIGVGVLATTIFARDISYGNTNVESALNDLYDKADSKKICELKSGTANTIGAMYECDPGDHVKRNFYVLEVRNKEVDLIMDRNLSGGMTWANAMKYFSKGDGVSIKNSWTNVLNIDLPKVQVIVNAVGRDWVVVDNDAIWWCFGSRTQDKQESPWCTNDNQENYAWLFNHLTYCTQAGCTDDTTDESTVGYWTRDLINNSVKAWYVAWTGALDRDNVSYKNHGVRPVITVSNNQLSN